MERVVEVPVDRVVEVQTEKIVTKEVPVVVVQDRAVMVSPSYGASEGEVYHIRRQECRRQECIA